MCLKILVLVVHEIYRGKTHNLLSSFPKGILIPHFPLFYHLGFTFTFRIRLDWQPFPRCWPYIRFLLVVVKESLLHFLHPSLTAFDLWFTTLGGNYLWSDFHRLAVCHARHTKKDLQIKVKP